jgi:peptide/nickel transport system permease protein
VIGVARVSPLVGRGSWRRRTALAAAGLIALGLVAAPALAPNPPTRQFADRQYAPPTRIRIHDGTRFRAPFIYAQVLDDRLLRRYRDDTTRPMTLLWFRNGTLLSAPADAGPLLLLGADPAGRDVFSRLVLGARRSLGVTVAGVAGALLVGAIAGALAGAIGGRVDSLLMLAADFVLVLPGAYLVLVLRGVLPPVLATSEIFALLALLFTFAAWPHVARGVRAIVATERTREYALAARASGAGPIRLARHLVPAASGFLAVEIVLLVPALLVAEATVSFLGLGFVDPHASWGTLLQDAANVTVMREAPWMLAPAVAIFFVVLTVQLSTSSRSGGLLAPSD